MSNTKKLFFAIQDGDVEGVRKALDSGVDVNGKLKGESPLHAAVADDREDILRILLDRGADISVTDKTGQNPLALALIAGHRACSELLLQHSTPQLIQQADKKGMTPLHWAAGLLDVKAIRLLLKAGADVNARAGKSRETPLYAAVLAADEDDDPESASEIGDVIKVLVGANADPLALTSTGASPLHIACMQHSAPAVSALLAVLPKKIKSATEVLCIDTSGITPLHYIAQWGNIRVLKRILDYINSSGLSDVNEALSTRTPDGDSACDLAHENHYSEMVEALIAAGSPAPVQTMPVAERKKKALLRKSKDEEPECVDAATEAMIERRAAAHAAALARSHANKKPSGLSSWILPALVLLVSVVVLLVASLYLTPPLRMQ